MKKSMIIACAILLFSFAANAAIGSNKAEDRYVLIKNAPVRISVDSGWQRDGRTPVRIDIPGLHLDLWMDVEGRVFDDKTHVFGDELFRLDAASGRLQAGGQTLTGQVYEKNALRTRLRLSNLTLALLIDIKKGHSALDLNGIIIPTRVRAGQEVSGVRELEIGSWGDRGQGRLFLDAGQGRLFFEDGNSLPAVEKQRASRVCWAEK